MTGISEEEPQPSLPEGASSTGSVSEQEPVSSWFLTFMCMNIPIYGWFYLKKLARQPEHNKMQDFARAYLYYKMVFLAVSLVIVILLLIVGIIGINKLFAYMELL